MPLTVVKRSTMVSKGQPLNCQSVPSVTTQTTRSHCAFVKLFTLSRTSKVHIFPMTLRTISTYSGLVLSKKRMRSSSFLWYSPSCKSLAALRRLTGEFLLHGTRMMGWFSLFSRIICSSSFSSGTLPRISCAGVLRSILQFCTSSCAILRIKSAFGTVLPGHRTSTSRSFTGLTRASTSAYEMSPALTSGPEDTDVSAECLAPSLVASSGSSRGRLRPSMTSLAMPVQISVRPTNQSQRSPRLATPTYLKPRFLVVSCVYGLSPEISRNMYHTDPMSMKLSVGDKR
mmetsp:Transcript_48796/g.156048  ORF Transcript_48796/g.156048 Transcript_48796/m.156048 type:complete len:286 (-) Transcript_48796:247-1104(-)